MTYTNYAVLDASTYSLLGGESIDDSMEPSFSWSSGTIHIDTDLTPGWNFNFGLVSPGTLVTGPGTSGSLYTGAVWSPPYVPNSVTVQQVDQYGANINSILIAPTTDSMMMMSGTNFPINAASLATVGSVMGPHINYADLTNKPSKSDFGLSNVDNTADASKTFSASQITSGTKTSSFISDFSTATNTLIAAQSGAVSGLCPLDSGQKIPTTYLPGLAITSVFTVASQVAQLALTAQEGDIAVRSDTNTTYVKNSGTSGTMSDWTQLLSPTGGVTSFNSRTGAVSPTSGDYTTDLVTEGSTNKYYTDERAQDGVCNIISGTSGVTTNYNDAANTFTISAPRTTSTLSLSLVGTGATGTQISSTKDSTVRLNVSTSTTSTIGGASTSLVALKICSTNSVTEGNWTTVTTLENDQTITLAVALQSIQVLKGQLCADVPTGWYVKLVNSGTGTHSEAFVSGQQTIYG